MDLVNDDKMVRHQKLRNPFMLARHCAAEWRFLSARAFDTSYNKEQEGNGPIELRAMGQ